MRNGATNMRSVGLLSFLAVLLVTASVEADEKLPDYYVLAFGVSDYANIPGLNAPADDARRTVECFRKFGADGPDAILNGDATAKRIRDELRSLEKRVKPHQTVVINVDDAIQCSSQCDPGTRQAA